MYSTCHTAPHNWNELNYSHEARKNSHPWKHLDLPYLVRGYRNISLTDKVILSKNHKILAEFITPSEFFIHICICTYLTFFRTHHNRIQIDSSNLQLREIINFKSSWKSKLFFHSPLEILDLLQSTTKCIMKSLSSICSMQREGMLTLSSNGQSYVKEDIWGVFEQCKINHSCKIWKSWWKEISTSVSIGSCLGNNVSSKPFTGNCCKVSFLQ